MEVEALLVALKPHADAGTLSAGVAAHSAGDDALLLTDAAAVADARAREGMGTSDFQPWTNVAIACTRAIGLLVEGTPPR